MAIPGGPAAMTVELCLAACQAAGYVLAGVEYAQECYCDNAFKNGGGPAPDGNALCDMACNGNPAETCGGPDRLDAYQFNSSGDPPATTTQSSGAATSTAPSTATGLPAGWAYYGCWVDNVNGRIMPMINDLPTQTIEGCIATCIDNGNYVAGLEYSTQCFCGDAIYSGGTLASSDSQCNMACGGNAAEICGAGNRMSVYSNQTLQVFAPAVPQTSGLPGSWTYQGCIT
jgi:WSC domain